MVVLRDFRDVHGSRFLEANLAPDGSLVIEGQDLGDGVEAIFGKGRREYEWTWRVAPDRVAPLADRLALALEAPPDLGILALLFLLYEEHRGLGVERFLGPGEDRIAAEFWSRVGE